MRAIGHIRILFIALLAVGCLFAGRAAAVQPSEVLSDPALEARARALSRELRCMVCQNQSIDDSDAPLAKDLRLLVRERLNAGSTDQQVLDYLVARYGEFVLLNPRVTAHSILLWVIPFGLLVGGAVSIAVIARRRRTSGTDSSEVALRLTPDEEKRVGSLLSPPDKSA